MRKKSDIILVGKEMSVIGGIQVVNRSVMNAFHGRGVKCVIFSFRERRGVGVLSRLSMLLCDVWRFNTLTRKRGRQFIFNVTGIEVLLFSVLCILKGKRFYYWLHGDPKVFLKNKSSALLAKYFFKHARASIVLHTSFVEKFSGSDGRITAIPNIVPQLLEHTANRAGREIRRVVWVGRASAEKNPVLAYAAMAELAEQFAEVEFTFVSPGNSAKTLQSRPLSSNFHFVDGNGFMPSEYFDDKTIHLLTSHLEAMPGVLFESTSCHAYFISTKCSPWVDDLAALGHGVSVPVDITVSQLVETISGLLEINSLDFCIDRVREFLARYNEGHVIRMWNDLVEEQ